MDFFAYNTKYAIDILASNERFGLSKENRQKNLKKYGQNIITKKKQDGFIKKLIKCLLEPMMVILLFSFILTLGINIGKKLKSGDGDFAECFGIIFAIILSVSITLFMESSSQKAFNILNNMYSNSAVKVIRDGKIEVISQSMLIVGDILLFEAGDKVNADCRLIEDNSLLVSESALTGESHHIEKKADIVLEKNTPLAERKNCLYAGTFIESGFGKGIVTAVGDNTEIGKIASELTKRQNDNSPLQYKLNKLGKIITIIGFTCALIVFIFSFIRLIAQNSLTFNSVQELFISCIVLIVAAVPEGLPTIVAISLALNMIKLAKENALIKKMTATETAGAVSVVCSDKTGTLTQNKMSVDLVCSKESCKISGDISEVLKQNFIINNSAKIIKDKVQGSATDGAILSFCQKNKIDILGYRGKYKIVDSLPFNSNNKYMTTDIEIEGKTRRFIKGAKEKVLPMCSLTDAQISTIQSKMEEREKMARRVICFAHVDIDEKEKTPKYIYDGFISLSDPIRKEVYKAISDCKRAGIKVKILTGDNKITAYSIAKELNVASDESSVINANQLENLDDNTFKMAISKINVIARSTPALKLRVVKALKEMGEVVAVTGDGINDAPAIKQADIGISMGISGSEITKEASDVVLLDDSFATVVKAISFGRNVYRNIQRFIIFQLSVNFSALLFVILSSILGLPSPFNTLELLWINVIMDGPPALTLGLELPSDALMNFKPVKKDSGLINTKMILRIVFNGIYIGVILILQYIFNFLNIPYSERNGAIFTLFILFQLFNAFNCRELGSESILKKLNKNKIMLLTFLGVFIIHIFIVSVASNLFNSASLSISSLIKCLILSSSIIFVSEGYKFIYRRLRVNEKIQNKG